jgi:transglutaminase-like putative cysteine protease
VKAVVHVKDAYQASGDKPAGDLCKSTARWPAEGSRQLAGRLTSGAKTAQEKVDAILTYVHGEIRYDGKITGSRYGVEQVLQQKYGHCWDKSDVFVTLCRAAQVPARQIAGWVPVMNSGHVWAEVYLDGQGWVPVDATASWTGTSEDYIPWFSTSDGEMPIVYLAWPTIRQRK